jgi:acyl-CoA dehydrogenase
MDFELTASQKELRGAIRDFIRRECPPELIRECRAQKRYDEGVWEKIAKAGWLGLNTPVESGGAGGNSLDMVIFFEEIARAHDVIAPIFPTMCFGSHLLKVAANEKQRKELTPELLEGKLRIAIGITEPGGGTDVLGAMKTRAVRDGDDWVINGAKMWTSLAKHATTLVVAARTSDEPRRADGISLFFVPIDTPGVTILPLEVVSDDQTNQSFYDNVRVPAENIIGEEGKGFYTMLSSLNEERLDNAALCVGWSQAALEIAIDYAKTREAFGGPIGRFQAIQQHIARMWMLNHQAKLATRHAAWLQSNDEPCGMEATAAKIIAAENGFTACDLGLQVFAGAGWLREAEINDYWRKCRLFRFAPITVEAGLNMIAESLGMPRSF